MRHISNYRNIVRMLPESATAHEALAMVLLRQGHYQEGWTEFEWRWKLTNLKKAIIPEWHGEALLNRTLLLTHEQGYGDSIQMLRYAPIFKELGGEILAQVPKELIRLTKFIKGIDHAFVGGEYEAHYAVPMLSIPRVCGTRIDNVPWDGAYINVPEIHPEVQKLNRPRVGLCWSGKRWEQGLKRVWFDHVRSLKFAQLKPLLDVQGIEWVSLQKEQRAPGIHDWMEGCQDFYDTATIINGLDLVISVDTSVVHLAGAMGKPVWLLSRADGCWRWGEGRKTPWYPTVRIYHQSKRLSWDKELAQIAKKLNSLWGKR